MTILSLSIEKELKRFLREDIGFGDITTNAVVPKNLAAKARIMTKESIIVAGLEEIGIIFKISGVKFKALVKDGEFVQTGESIAEVEGNARTILEAERTILNLLMRMSGIATTTRNLVNMINECGVEVRIAATRKTAPGLRYFDKKAVKIGGGDPHRWQLDDAFLVKDNHIEIAGSVREALLKIQESASFSKKIEVEAKTMTQAREAAENGANIIMLDNMSVKKAEKTLQYLEKLNLRSKVLVEISGSINEENLLDYAKLKPDLISIGALTHSSRAIDLSLEIIKS